MTATTMPVSGEITKKAEISVHSTSFRLIGDYTNEAWQVFRQSNNMLVLSAFRYKSNNI